MTVPRMRISSRDIWEMNSRCQSVFHRNSIAPPVDRETPHRLGAEKAQQKRCRLGRLNSSVREGRKARTSTCCDPRGGSHVQAACCCCLGGFPACSGSCYGRRICIERHEHAPLLPGCCASCIAGPHQGHVLFLVRRKG